MTPSNGRCSFASRPPRCTQPSGVVALLVVVTCAPLVLLCGRATRAILAENAELAPDARISMDVTSIWERDEDHDSPSPLNSSPTVSRAGSPDPMRAHDAAASELL